MNERQFTDELIDKIKPVVADAQIKSGVSVLYEMPIDDDGRVRMGVDQDSGEAIRGKGTGFEQDVLIFEEKTDGNTSIIPRVIIEIKYAGVTTHDAIVYSYKAESIKRVYPIVRFGMVIGGFKTIPGRLLRLGRQFDFIMAMEHPFVDAQVDELRTIVTDELSISRSLGSVLRGKRKLRVLRKHLTINE